MTLSTDENQRWLAANGAAFEVWDHSLSPVEAELRVRFRFREPVEGLDLRGRVVGPRCKYASTVEVAYPLRPLSGGQEPADTLTARCVIPEPSLWEPACPFLYEVRFELRRGGAPAFAGAPEYGLRRVQLGGRGLLWNGQPLALRGAVRAGLQPDDARSLRQAGCNLLLLPSLGPVTDPGQVGEVLPGVLDLYGSADRLGFLVLSRLPPCADALIYAEMWRSSASCLGWLLPQEAAEKPAYLEGTLARFRASRRQVLGIELARPFAGPLPEAVSFVACPVSLLPEVAHLRRPALLLTAAGTTPGSEAADRPGILGWVEV